MPTNLSAKKMNKYLRPALSFLLLLTMLVSFGQLSSFPSDYQLYPRNFSTNLAVVNIQGSYEQSSGYTELRLKRYRNGSFQGTTTVPLLYVGGIANFSFSVDIPAELANYRFDLFAFNNAVETLVRTANNVVAGDAYIIQGQSNAVANIRGSYDASNDANSFSNAPNRQFVRVYGGASSTGNYSKRWFIGEGNAWFENDFNAGQWGMRMASNIAGTQGIPVCIMNGANPGRSITWFQRNDGNPTDINSNYGRLLQRITEAGLKNHIRGVFWYQGENDAAGSLSPAQMSTTEYKNLFLELYNDWKSDFPNISRIYVAQIRFGCGMFTREGCLQIQEAQRQVAKELTDVSIISTNNTTHLLENTSANYCHYKLLEGYQKIGDWMSLIVRKQLYNATQLPSSVEPPKPVSAIFSAFSSPGIASQVSITLEDPNTTYTINGDLTSEFSLSGGSYTVTGVTLNGSQLLINFVRNSGTTTNPTAVNYLSHNNLPAPIITNAGGLGLVHFGEFPINQLPVATCGDIHESNDLFTTAKAISLNTVIKGNISSPTDGDWFQIQTTSTARNVKISLYNLPADYNVFLYDMNRKLIARSTKSGLTNEVLIYNGGPLNARYNILVSSANGVFNLQNCYSLYAETSATQYEKNSKPTIVNALNAVSSPMEVSASNISSSGAAAIDIFPSPAISDMLVKFNAMDAGNVILRLVDMAGRELQRLAINANSGSNTRRMNVSGYTPGIYLLQVQEGEKISSKKVVVGFR
ncbi:sialate O-acetylesterase [Flavihumibacter sp.]|uniref:sialate O-acetylesterase n=1 Tax=Flavihumibacter sp. TaxID=1913981 RepID=UPI002FC5A7D4